MCLGNIYVSNSGGPCYFRDDGHRKEILTQEWQDGKVPRFNGSFTSAFPVLLWSTFWTVVGQWVIFLTWSCPIRRQVSLSCHGPQTRLRGREHSRTWNEQLGAVGPSLLEILKRELALAGKMNRELNSGMGSAGLLSASVFLISGEITIRVVIRTWWGSCGVKERALNLGVRKFRCDPFSLPLIVWSLVSGLFLSLRFLTCTLGTTIQTRLDLYEGCTARVHGLSNVLFRDDGERGRGWKRRREKLEKEVMGEGGKGRVSLMNSSSHPVLIENLLVSCFVPDARG